uniref:RRM domain-containing protein n=1 Tax=Compsopogon caeruleus TaxID=31354 RepID=A0A7S1TD22_9RHOD|mmetsp:Transcript_17214/g.35771  ORF Transcript_17214/g.35771 Transcript_17214/m.35771 type:complete len:379 (+) Transcript_17214:145-1281(+)
MRLYVRGVPDWVTNEALASKMVAAAELDMEKGLGVLTDFHRVFRHEGVFLSWLGTAEQLGRIEKTLNGTSWGGRSVLRVESARPDYMERLQEEWRAEESEKNRIEVDVPSSPAMIGTSVNDETVTGSEHLRCCRATRKIRWSVDEDDGVKEKSLADLTWEIEDEPEASISKRPRIMNVADEDDQRELEVESGTSKTLDRIGMEGIGDLENEISTALRILEGVKGASTEETRSHAPRFLSIASKLTGRWRKTCKMHEVDSAQQLAHHDFLPVRFNPLHCAKAPEISMSVKVGEDESLVDHERTGARLQDTPQGLVKDSGSSCGLNWRLLEPIDTSKDPRQEFLIKRYAGSSPLSIVSRLRSPERSAPDPPVEGFRFNFF